MCVIVRYDVEVTVRDATSTSVTVNISVNLHHLTRQDVTMATPVEIAMSPADLIKKMEVRHTSHCIRPDLEHLQPDCEIAMLRTLMHET